MREAMLIHEPKRRLLGRAQIIYQYIQYQTSSCRKRGKYADSWLVLFVIDCIISEADQKTLVAPEKINFLARSVQFPLSNPYL